MKENLLYTCPSCGHRVFRSIADKRRIPRHPQFDEIEADLALGVHVTYIQNKYNLTRAEAVKYHTRFWQKTRARSRKQW